jgi:hypothetical protein
MTQQKLELRQKGHFDFSSGMISRTLCDFFAIPFEALTLACVFPGVVFSAGDQTFARQDGHLTVPDELLIFSP